MCIALKSVYKKVNTIQNYGHQSPLVPLLQGGGVLTIMFLLLFFFHVVLFDQPEIEFTFDALHYPISPLKKGVWGD